MTSLEEITYSTPLQPRQVRLDTIASCNARCLICHAVDQDRKWKRDGSQMSISFIEKILDNIRFYFPKPLEEIVPVNYGEFFLRRDAFDILQLISSRLPNSRIVIPTNGSMMDEEKVKQLSRIPTLKLVNVSLNAYFDETYEAVVGLPVEKMRQAKKLLDLPKLRPDITVWASMFYDQTLITEREKELFQSSIQGNPQAVVNAASFCSSLVRQPIVQARLPCRSIFSDLVILNDGQATSCCFDVEGVLKLGRFPQQNLLDIWHGKAFAQLRQAHNTGRRAEYQICSACTFA